MVSSVWRGLNDSGTLYVPFGEQSRDPKTGGNMRNGMRTIVSLATLFLLVFGAGTASAKDVVDHSPFTSILQKYVDANGDVAYGELKENSGDLEKLQSYLKKVAEAEPGDHSEKAQLAFYLNAYNAAVIASIVDHWPTDSPKSIKGFFKSKTHEIAGKELTLDGLEHELIREKWDEPRIHFVLVCAAKSCPTLQRKALTEGNLESVLSSAAETFVPEATELKDGKVATSKLFKWFSSDFEGAAGSVRKYLAKYTSGEVKKALVEKEADITYSDYDWSVNSQ